MGKVFNDKNWTMGKYAFEYGQLPSWQKKKVKKRGILLEIGSSDGDFTCHVFSLEDAKAHLETSDPRGILTIEK